jgi:hypothetical protein
MRQLAMVIDYLIWMPLATGVSLFATILGYGLAVSLIEPFPRAAAILLTTVLLISWPVCIFLLARNMGNEAPSPVPVLAGVAFAVPTTALLAVVFNLLNACNAGVGFPLSGGECPFS